MAIVSGNEFFGGQPGTVVQSANDTPLNIPPKAERKSLWERTKQGVVGDVKRIGMGLVEDAAGIQERQNSGQQNLAESALQTLGVGAKTAGDVVFGEPARMLFRTLSEDTQKDIKEGAAGGIQKVMSVPEIASAVQSIQKWADENPGLAADLGAATNIATTFTGGKVAEETGQIAKEEGKQALKFGKEAVGDVVESGVKKVGEAVKPELQSAKIMQRVARISKGKQAKFEKTAGESVGEYLVSRKIFGDVEDVSNQLYDRFTSSKKAADDALQSLQGTYKSKPVETALDELLSREVRVSSPGALSKDFARVRELSNKYKESGLSMSEINEVKRLYERNVKLDFVKQNLPESVARSTNVDNALREWQFTQAEKLGLKNLPNINKETRLAKQLLDDLGQEHAGSAGNNAVTLTDWIMLSGGDPTAAALFLAKKAVSSKGIQSRFARALSSGKAKVELPQAEFGKPKGDYADFIRATEDRAKPQ